MRFTVLSIFAVSAVLVVGLILFGAGRPIGGLFRPPADPVIDGWVVGTERPYEAAYVDAATELLAKLDPGHAAVVRASVHNEGIYYDKDGGQLLWSRSGRCCAVVLFELADGSKRAVGAGTPGISQTVMAFETGPVMDRPGAPDSP